jgi:hypothetical protein
MVFRSPKHYENYTLYTDYYNTFIYKHLKT